jgi:uncharacterized protein YbaP (TraB family)
MRLSIVSCFTTCFFATVTMAAEPALEVERATKPAMPATPAPALEKDKSEQASGPPLWKVTHTNGHVLWILGTINPKPKGFKWQGEHIAQAAEASQLVLRQGNELPATFEVELSALDPLQHVRVALHKKGASDSDDNRKALREVLPPALYARFEVQRRRFLPDSKRIEYANPHAAAERLYNAALQAEELTTRATIHEQVERVASRHDIDTDNVVLQMKVNVKTAMEIETERSKHLAAAEIACLSATVEQLETQLPIMRTRADAWAAGDVAQLRQLPLMTRDACNYATWSSPRWNDLPQRLADEWLATAESAMREHRSTFALVDISHLLKPNDLLTALSKKGYRIDTP